VIPEMECVESRYRRPGTNPPKNESGSTSAVASVSSSQKRTPNSVSAGNGYYIAAKALLTVDVEHRGYFTYAVVVLKYRNDVIQAPRLVARLPYNDRQGWPDGQCLPHHRVIGAEKSEIQATW